MRTILIIAIIFLCIGIIGYNIFYNRPNRTKDVDIEKVYVDNTTGKKLISHFNKSGKLNGESILFQNGKIVSKGNFIDGLRNGWVIQYFNNGQIKNKLYYENDKPGGIEYDYFENGELKYKATWKNGKRFGDGYQFYKNGKIRLYAAFDSISNSDFYECNFDTLGGFLKQRGTLISREIYSIKEKNGIKNKVILKNSQSYRGIDDFYIVIATPPMLQRKLLVSTNGKKNTPQDMGQNVLKFKNAFPVPGIYLLKIERSLLNEHNNILAKDSLMLRIIKLKD